MAQRKGMSIAIGATARKLCEHIYRAQKYGQEYVDQGARPMRHVSSRIGSSTLKRSKNKWVTLLFRWRWKIKFQLSLPTLCYAEK